MTPDTASSKDQWRTQFRAYRQGLSAASHSARGALIGTRTLNLPVVAAATVVHVYWPQLDQGEVDTRLLIGALRCQDATVVLPVVTSYDPSAPEMEHRRYAGPDAMTPNRWGIREPTGTERISPAALDVVLVPALGAGRNGHRIGHGSGYYDAFLQSINVPKVILVYAECLRPTVPADSHDVPGTHIVTERSAFQIEDQAWRQ